jgi:hypothetical protein
VGYDVAEPMGLLPALREIGYHVTQVRIVNKPGHRVADFDAAVFRLRTVVTRAMNTPWPGERPVARSLGDRIDLDA